MAPPPRRLRSLLVANRGEIARRIMRTAREMGLRTIAVYADGDADAPFVREADEAVALGGRTAAESYLDVAKILDAARRSGAEAIHPGYGFLSENAGFARAVEDAGLVWVGPPADAIAAMGDKLAAKRAMDAAGVPTLPSHEVAPGADVAAPAHAIGYPLLVKASAGGGGKGMRVVETPDDLQAAIEAARREAAGAFGDDTVFLERWLARTRHVEVQVLGDQLGNVVHCFERECSIQRRHQKIIEEAPSPALDDGLRDAMGAAAVQAAAAIGYTSAGTVEFLLSGRDFWFLEMNTRLQVEHPVTEAICGLDLVREQIRIAQGEPLSVTPGRPAHRRARHRGAALRRGSRQRLPARQRHGAGLAPAGRSARALRLRHRNRLPGGDRVRPHPGQGDRPRAHARGSGGAPGPRARAHPGPGPDDQPRLPRRDAAPPGLPGRRHDDGLHRSGGAAARARARGGGGAAGRDRGGPGRAGRPSRRGHRPGGLPQRLAQLADAARGDALPPRRTATARSSCATSRGATAPSGSTRAGGSSGQSCGSEARAA